MHMPCPVKLVSEFTQLWKGPDLHTSESLGSQSWQALENSPLHPKGNHKNTFRCEFKLGPGSRHGNSPQFGNHSKSIDFNLMMYPLGFVGSTASRILESDSKNRFPWWFQAILVLSLSSLAWASKLVGSISSKLREMKQTCCSLRLVPKQTKPTGKKPDGDARSLAQ